MKKLLCVSALALLATGCAVVPRHGYESSTVYAPRYEPSYETRYEQRVVVRQPEVVVVRRDVIQPAVYVNVKPRSHKKIMYRDHNPYRDQNPHDRPDENRRDGHRGF